MRDIYGLVYHQKLSAIRLICHFYGKLARTATPIQRHCASNKSLS